MEALKLLIDIDFEAAFTGLLSIDDKDDNIKTITSSIKGKGGGEGVTSSISMISSEDCHFGASSSKIAQIEEEGSISKSGG